MSKKQIGIRIDEKIYKTVKIMLVNEEKTLQEYLESLIINDLLNKNIKLKKE